MSTKFSNIKKIFFDDVEGKIGDSFIYNLSFNQGFSSEASTLTVSAISEDGNYSSIPSPNFEDVYTIRVEDKIVFRGFILSKEIQIGENNKIASITLIDKSVRLDQYGIGLINRHGHIPPTTRFISVTAKGVSPLGEVKFTRPATFKRDLADGVQKFGSLFAIGREKLTSSPCDIPDVEYLQEHFDTAISMFSGEVGITFATLPEIISGRNYTGTIREVLNSLCSDAGKSFYYDSGLDSIVLFNLDAKFIDDSIIDLIKTDESIVIQNFTESESLENTFGNFVSVREMRSGKEQGGEGTCTTPVTNLLALPFLRISHFDDIFHAACLAKISEGLRDQFYIQKSRWANLDWWDVQEIFSSFSITTQSGADGACIDLGARNIHESRCTVDRVASKLNMDPTNVQQIFDNNPSLKDGFKVYLVNVGDGSFKETVRTYEERYLEQYGPLYEAVYSPQDIEFLNITGQEGGGAGQISDPRGKTTPVCTHISTTQSPEPEYMEPFGLPAGWYFRGGGDWDYSQIDLTEVLSLLRPSIVDVTPEMALMTYEGVSNRTLKQGDLDGVHPDDSNYDNTAVINDDGSTPCIDEPKFDIVPIRQSHVVFVPTVGSNQIIGDGVVKNVRTKYFKMDSSYKSSTGSYKGNETNEDCVPFDIVENPTYRKGNTGCFGSCNDQTLDEVFPEFETCGKNLPTGEICGLHRVGIEFDLMIGGTTIENLFVASPSRSDTGYRSNLTINYKSNNTTGRSMKISSFQTGQNNFAKLNINDIDATSTLFDPDSQSNHFVVPETVGVSFDSIAANARQVYGSFTSGSSKNNLPRKISMSLVGVPEHIDKVLNVNSVSSYNINFGNDGLSMSIEYADSPPTPPSMDYLQSRLHNQFHYATMNKYHR